MIFGSVVDAAPKFNNARPRALEIREPRPIPQSPAPAQPPTVAPPAAAPPAAAPPAAGQPSTPPAPGAAPALTDTDILQL